MISVYSNNELPAFLRTQRGDLHLVAGSTFKKNKTPVRSHGLQLGPRFCEVLCHRDPVEVLRRTGALTLSSDVCACFLGSCTDTYMWVNDA